MPKRIASFVIPPDKNITDQSQIETWPSLVWVGSSEGSWYLYESLKDGRLFDTWVETFEDGKEYFENFLGEHLEGWVEIPEEIINYEDEIGEYLEKTMKRTQ